MNKDIKALIDSHGVLMNAALLQVEKYPRQTCRAIEDAIANAKKFTDSIAFERLKLKPEADRTSEWESAAQWLAYAIQNPTDKEAAWRAVIAFVKVNGTVNPKVSSMRTT
jgi:hypothetical protein